MFAILMLVALAAPPVPGDVVSGAALNDLLTEIAKQQARGATAGAAPIEESLRLRINIRPEKTIEANPALLRDAGKITWPAALAKLEPAEPTADARRRVEKFLALGYQQMKDRPVEPVVVRDLTSAIAELEQWLTKRVAEVPPTEYAPAKRTLTLLKGAAETLALVDAKEYLPGGKNSAIGDDVEKLTRHLIEKKLRIASAAPGDEAAYQKLHQELTRYANALRVAAP